MFLAAGDIAFSAEKFVEEQKRLLEEEQKVEVAEKDALLRGSSQSELQRRGLALYNVHVTSVRTGFRGKTVVDVEPVSGGREVFPAHRIKTGDLVAIESVTLSTSVPKDGKTRKASANHAGFTQASRVTGVVSKLMDTRLSVVVGVNDDISDALSSKCRVAQLANSITYERMKEALEGLRQRLAQPANLGPLGRALLHQEKPTFCADSEDDLRFHDPMLNESQKDAIRFALCADHVALIHGPPGTGKTFTLVELIRQFADRRKRMLVCGPSNVSVDNLVERLAKCKLSIVRLGHPARMLPAVVDHSLDVVTRTCEAGRIVEDIRREMDQTLVAIQKSKSRADRKAMYANLHELRKDYKRRERNIVEGILRNSQVVLSTLNGAGSNILRNEDFDVVIVDEATQALEAECWIALLKGSKAILAGDHLQLPPTVKSTCSPKRLEYTLFQRVLDAYGDTVKRLLITQYRMNELIMAYPSNQLYGGRLVAHDSVRHRLLCELAGAVRTEDTEIPLLLIDTTGCGMNERTEGDERAVGRGTEEADQSKLNEVEADLVANHVRTLAAAGIEADKMAVITPYNAQVGLLRKLLKEEFPGLEIGSVDGFQGREKEAVIISLVRSNDNHDVGFLAEKRRINVAITRPKRHLCVICDSETVGNDKFIDGLLDYIMEYGEVRYANSQEF